MKQNLARIGGSAMDGRTTRHVDYDISQRQRRCIEHCFGWTKESGPIRQAMVHELVPVDHAFAPKMTVGNLVRLRNLGGVQA